MVWDSLDLGDRTLQISSKSLADFLWTDSFLSPLLQTSLNTPLDDVVILTSPALELLVACLCSFSIFFTWRAHCWLASTNYREKQFVNAMGTRLCRPSGNLPWHFVFATSQLFSVVALFFLELSAILRTCQKEEPLQRRTQNQRTCIASFRNFDITLSIAIRGISKYWWTLKLY